MHSGHLLCLRRLRMNNKRVSLLEYERLALQRLIFVALISIISGLYTWLTPFFNTAYQLTVFVHVVSGCVLSVFVTPYIVRHFKRTLGLRRPLVTLSGLLLVGVMITGIGTGFYLTVYGVVERYRWVLEWHIVSMLLTAVFVVLHVVLHAYTHRRRQSKNEAQSWPSLEGFRVFRLVKAALGLGVLIVSGAWLYSLVEVVESSLPAVAEYQYPYGDNPFAPSETRSFNNLFIPAKALAQSDSCANCHADIVEQWNASAHKHAASDPAYVTNINLLEAKKGIVATRYCEGCHAPVALLAGELTPGGKHGGVSGTMANQEGVGCLSCHRMSRVLHTKGVASFEMGPPSAYMFSAVDSQIATWFRQKLIQWTPEQHKQEMTPEAIDESQYCASCHVQFMDKNLNHWGWVKMQDEYSAWLEGPYSGKNAEEFGLQPVMQCQDCHMAQIAAHDPSANKQGMIASHYFTGANTMLPFIRGDKAHLSRTTEFLRQNRLSMTIDIPNRKKAHQTDAVLNPALRTRTEQPAYYALGETVDVNVLLTNHGVGHNFPGGTVDINEAWVEFLVYDAMGKMVFSSGELSGDQFARNSVDPNAEFYRSRPVDREGKLVWKHDLFNRVGEAEKRVIPAGKTDVLAYTFSIPDWVLSPMTITATLKYRKLNDRYARWSLREKYLPLPIVDIARDTAHVLVLNDIETKVN